MCAPGSRCRFARLVWWGALHGSSSVPNGQSHTTPHEALGLRGVFEQPLGSRFALALWGEVDATLGQTTFLFQDGPVWESALLGTTLGGTFVVLFP